MTVDDEFPPSLEVKEEFARRIASGEIPASARERFQAGEVVEALDRFRSTGELPLASMAWDYFKNLRQNPAWQADAEALRSDLQGLASDPDYPDARGIAELAIWADTVLVLLADDDPWWYEGRVDSDPPGA